MKVLWDLSEALLLWSLLFFFSVKVSKGLILPKVEMRHGWVELHPHRGGKVSGKETTGRNFGDQLAQHFSNSCYCLDFAIICIVSALLLI